MFVASIIGARCWPGVQLQLCTAPLKQLHQVLSALLKVGTLTGEEPNSSTRQYLGTDLNSCKSHPLTFTPLGFIPQTQGNFYPPIPRSPGQCHIQPPGPVSWRAPPTPRASTYRVRVRSPCPPTLILTLILTHTHTDTHTSTAHFQTLQLQKQEDGGWKFKRVEVVFTTLEE